MIERFRKSILDRFKNRRLDARASKEARQHYIIALDKVTSFSPECFQEFPGNGDNAKEKMKLSLVSELTSLGAQRDVSGIIKANKGRSWPRTLTAEERFRYRK